MASRTRDWVDVWNAPQTPHEYFVGRQKRLQGGQRLRREGKRLLRKGVNLDAILSQVATGPRETIRKTKSESLTASTPSS